MHIQVHCNSYFHVFYTTLCISCITNVDFVFRQHVLPEKEQKPNSCLDNKMRESVLEETDEASSLVQGKETKELKRKKVSMLR